MAEQVESATVKHSTPVIESTETDGQPAEDEVENTLTDPQLRAISAIIETIYRHRLPEYVSLYPLGHY